MKIENLINFIDEYFAPSNRDISLATLFGLALNVDYAIKEKRNSEKTPIEEAYDRGFEEGKRTAMPNIEDCVW